MATSNPPASGNKRRVARAEAAAWIVRLHGPHRCAELEEGFRAWLAADAENGRQFERVTEVWEAGSAPVAGVPRLGSWRAQPPARRWVAAAAVLLAAIGIGAWGANRFWLNPSYATGIGEQRIVRLEDGSRVSLNSNTRVSVAYRDLERRIRIERGEAYFEVATNRARPFVVVAGDRQVTALGTTFVVRYEADRTAVTLVEGKVAVSQGETQPASMLAASSQPGVQRSGSGPAEAFLLAPGERLTFEGAVATLDAPRMEAVSAWRRGEVMLDKTALGDAVTEMNRYDEIILVVDDPTIAGLRVSGIYHTGDSDGFAQTIAKLYGLEVDRQGDRIHLRPAAESKL